MPAWVQAAEPANSEIDFTLYMSLHLNAAAAALKLSEFATTKAMCEHVLAADATNSKAQFRLAKALEGADPDQTVAAFLMAHPEHRAAARRAQIAARFPYAEIRDNTIVIWMSEKPKIWIVNRFILDSYKHFIENGGKFSEFIIAHFFSTNQKVILNGYLLSNIYKFNKWFCESFLYPK